MQAGREGLSGQGRLGGTRTWGVAGTLSSFGVSLGRFLRALPGALGSRGE